MDIIATVVCVFWCLALSFVDLREHRLPNILTLPGAVIVLAYAACTGRFLPALLGALLLTVPYLVIHLVAPAAFGAGDVKLALGLGAAAALAGPTAWTIAALGAPVLTATVGLLLRHRRAVIPHGPAMCAATLFAVILR